MMVICNLFQVCYVCFSFHRVYNWLSDCLFFDDLFSKACLYCFKCVCYHPVCPISPTFFFVHLMKHYYNCYFPLTPRGSLYTTQYHIFATKKSLMGLLFIIYEKRLSFVLWSVQKMESGNIKNVNDRQFEWHSKSICLKELLPLWYQI